MKNQYYGDINDYRKYGLLRTITRSSRVRFFVNWMLTPDDTGPDGRFIEYLAHPDRWRDYDPELFDSLKSHVDAGRRSVSLIERSDLLSADGFCSRMVPDDRHDRERWFEHFLDSATNSDLVFFDPDNGLEVKSTAFGQKNSSKYLYWHELEKVWTAGLSVLLYQHFPRIPRSVFVEEITRQVGLKTPGSKRKAFATANVLFLLVTQPLHSLSLPLQQIVQSLQERWKEEFKVI